MLEPKKELWNSAETTQNVAQRDEKGDFNDRLRDRMERPRKSNIYLTRV